MRKKNGPLRGIYPRPPTLLAGFFVVSFRFLSYGLPPTSSVSSPYLVRIILICTFADVGTRPAGTADRRGQILTAVILKNNGKK